jgi:hypothetical protein
MSMSRETAVRQAFICFGAKSYSHHQTMNGLFDPKLLWHDLIVALQTLQATVHQVSEHWSDARESAPSSSLSYFA